MKTRIALAALAVASGSALASFDAQWDSLAGVNDSIHIDNTGTGGSINQNFNAGQWTWHYVGAGDRGGGQFSGGSFATFCIELQNIGNGPHTFDVNAIHNAPNPSPGVGGPQYDLADEAEVNAVVAAAIALGWINADLSHGTGTNQQLAAIQGMIWQVVLDDAVVTAANAGVGLQMSALQAQISLNPNATVQYLAAMTSLDSQDQLFIVPLPTAAFAGLMTLVGLVGVKRLRRG